jgi:hypothetical protein
MKKEQQSVSVPDHYSTASYGATVNDEPHKPVLYTHEGKPLTRGLRAIGFTPRDEKRSE